MSRSQEQAEGCQLVQVPFHGETLEAVRDEAGDVWVSVRRVCENLGLAPNSQRQKLANKSWCRGTIIISRDARGSEQESYVIHIDTLPMWLATIEPSRVSPEIREKLIQYQKDAARVLADHFYGRRSAGMTREEIIGLIDDQVAAAMAASFARFEQMIQRAVQSALPATRFQPVGPLVSVRSRCEYLGWDTSTLRNRSRITQNVNMALLERYQEGPSMIGNLSHYHGHQLAVLDSYIHREWEKARRQETQALQPSLFGKN